MHLDRIRQLTGDAAFAKVVTKNNFPIGTGLSSSASGFAALSFAAAKSAGLNLSERELSILARQGSGSACRSIPDGFVEWMDGDTSETSYAKSLFPADYWEIADVVAVVSEGRKDISTSEGQKLVATSPFFHLRNEHIKNKIDTIKNIFAEKNFVKFGELIEAEALELHAIMITSNPSLIYWTPGTLTIMKQVKKWRAEGIPVYFTINTGQDIHLICQKSTVNSIKKKLESIEGVKNIIVNTPSRGTYEVSEHLF